MIETVNTKSNEWILIYNESICFHLYGKGDHTITGGFSYQVSAKKSDGQAKIEADGLEEISIT